MNRFYKKKGFTLLELMIVVIIVGILASLAMPRFITAVNKAKEAEAKAILGTIRSSQLRYYLENNNTYATLITALDADISPNPSDYFLYSVGAGPVGTATALDGTGLSTFTITADGVIAP